MARPPRRVSHWLTTSSLEEESDCWECGAAGQVIHTEKLKRPGDAETEQLQSERLIRFTTESLKVASDVV